MKNDDPVPPSTARDLFLLALDQPDAARAAFVAKACGQDEALRARVEALLRSHREDSFMESPANVPNEAVSSASTDTPGTVIGRYKLIQKLGEGGCGTVYLAEQEEPVRRQVALKLIKAGMDTAGFIARFEAERQALALMDHPNIARVFDAGATETGRPYLVMELVQGTRITEFCDAQNLSTHARLELFTQVCRAIQHAHQKGVIHRDIKPSNVLVTLHDGVPLPKVIDFGIAKATGGERLTDQTHLTALDQFVGTPAYMSPEQAGMNRRDIDTRSDIYSLGVLLYELLAGATPFDSHELLQRGFDEMRRVIRDQEPPKPSTRLAAGGEQKPRNRNLETSRAERIRALRGDLDWIVMKALEKERTRRYETASGFAEDIQRHLRNEPVLAGPPSGIYRVRKMVRRHRLAFTAASIIVAGLVIGLTVAGWGLHRERLARQRAEKAEGAAKTESIKSKQVALILRNMLAGAAPEIALGRDTTVLREMVDVTAANLARDTRDHPEAEADVRTTLGEVYVGVGEYTKAEAQFRQSLALRQRILGEEHLQVTASLRLLGVSLYHQSRAAEAEALFRQALALRGKLAGRETTEAAQSMNDLARALNLQNKTNEAASLQRDALALQVKLLGSNSLEVATSVHNLANDLLRQRKYAEAETHLRWALDIFQQAHGTNHPDVSTAQHGLASALYKQGKDAEAEPLFREVVRAQKHFYGPDHPGLGVTLRNLVSLLRRTGRLPEAEELSREALGSARRGGVFSPLDLEGCLYETGSVVLDRAWAEFESTPEQARAKAGLAARGREADTLLREYLARHVPTNDSPSANVRSHLASALTLVAATDDTLAPNRDATLAGAESLLLAAHARQQTSTSTTPELKRKTLLHLARLYQVWGKPEKAVEWQARLREPQALP